MFYLFSCILNFITLCAKIINFIEESAQRVIVKNQKYPISFLLIFSLLFYFPVFSQTQSIPKYQSENILNENLTVDELQKKYPNAEIKQVPIEELESLRRNKAYQECDSIESKGNNRSLEKGHYQHTDLNDRGPFLNFNNYVNFNNHGDKEFLILVAVVGVMVVAALIVYSAGYLYQTTSASLKCLTWIDFGFRASFISDSTSTQSRSGFMHGLYFSSGYRIPIGVMGLMGELGIHSFDLTINQSSSHPKSPPTNSLYRGTYFLIGPSFSIPFSNLNEHLFQIDLLAGTSNNKNIGLISTLRFGLLFRMSSQFNIGLNAGAALINIKGFESYLNESDQLNTLLGTSISYKW
jgi:hypothetical protein